MALANCKVKYIRPKYNNLKEWMDDENNIYIGRTCVVFIDNKRFPSQQSNFANPFKIGKDGTRSEIITKYKDYITTKLDNDNLLKKELIYMKGKTLGCWCYPEPCHGDILLDLIDQYYVE